MPVSNVGRVLNLTAPVGGVIAGNPYVIQNAFVVAAQTKNAGETFVGYFKDIVVTLPYYQGTTYKYQPAHWYITTQKITDFEGEEVGFLMGDYGPADLTCDVMLTGHTYGPQQLAVAPLVGGKPYEVSCTMNSGSGVGTLTVPDWCEAFELDLTTNGNWGNNNDIVVTVTRPGTTTSCLWVSMARGVPGNRVLRESLVIPTTNTLTVTIRNTSGATVSSGNRITTGVIWRIGCREI